MSSIAHPCRYTVVFKSSADERRVSVYHCRPGQTRALFNLEQTPDGEPFPAGNVGRMKLLFDLAHILKARLSLFHDARHVLVHVIPIGVAGRRSRKKNLSIKQTLARPRLRERISRCIVRCNNACEKQSDCFVDMVIVRT